LASIGNQAEQDFVYNTFSSPTRLLWIGFNDVASEGNFAWSSGEPVTFTNWAPGEPNDAIGGEDFTAIYQPGHPYASKWNDFGERVVSGNLPINGVAELILQGGPPRIQVQPQGALVNRGATISLSVSATGASPLRYQWQRNGTNISGATRTGYQLMNAQYANSGTYRVVVTNLIGSVTSTGAVVVVNREPLARCLSTNVAADATCTAQVSIDNGSSDPDSDGLVITQSPPGPYPIGSTKVLLTVTDSHGLSSTCDGVVTVRDMSPPAIVCPGDMTHDTDPSQCGAVVTFPLPAATDPCSGVTNVACTPSSGSFFPVGVTTVQCTAADSAGNVARCTFNVTVRDTQAPAIECDSISVTNAHDAWTSIVTFSPVVSDNCPEVTSSCRPSSGAVFNLGTNAVTCSATDKAGNSSECQFKVIVFPGNAPPVPRIQVSPLALFPGNTNLIVIAPDGQTAMVTFDGSKSSDPDDASFHYYWYEEANLFSTNVVATKSLSPGSHIITLLLDDTFPLGTNSLSVTVGVISPAAATSMILDLLNNSNLAGNRVQPLGVSVKAAGASFDRGSVQAGINQLSAFQNKVRAQVAPFDPQLAAQLIQAAQIIIDVEAGR
jgi:hypothetical protein